MSRLSVDRAANMAQRTECRKQQFRTINSLPRPPRALRPLRLCVLCVLNVNVKPNASEVNAEHAQTQRTLRMRRELSRSK